MDHVTDDLAEKVTAAIAAGVSDEAMAALKKKVDEILYDVESDIMYRLKDALAPNLSAFVAEMAEKTVSAILEGNENEMRRYLHCEEHGWTGRSTGAHWGERDIARWHSVIHGRLFEQGCVALRKNIVEAHRELLVNERILDLEDQVKSLVAQVNKADAEKEDLRQRLRCAA